jgi:hypothetical protein
MAWLWGDQETKPTPNLGVAHWYRQSTFPGTLGNYLDAGVRARSAVENAVGKLANGA